MLKNKKLIITIMIILLIFIAIIITALFVLPNFSKEIQSRNNSTKQTTTEQEVPEEELENKFLSIFTDIDYNQENQEIISTVYEYQRNEENKYEVNVHIPKINFETCKGINSEILEIFGRKLLDIVQNNQEFTKYNVDYVSYSNQGIISLIIKCTLKEGSSPQRVIIKTYNYYINEERLITLEEIIKNKNIDEQKLQEQIYKKTRQKNENAQALAEQGYNIYVRDLSSAEYEIANIENYYLGNDGNVYIVFAYGNKNFTETIDIIRLK